MGVHILYMAAHELQDGRTQGFVVTHLLCVDAHTYAMEVHAAYWVRTCSVWAYTYCVVAAHTSCMDSHILHMGLNMLCVGTQHLYVGLHNAIVCIHLRHDERPKSHVLGYHTSGWAPSNPNSLRAHTLTWWLNKPLLLDAHVLCVEVNVLHVENHTFQVVAKHASILMRYCTSNNIKPCTPTKPHAYSWAFNANDMGA